MEIANKYKYALEKIRSANNILLITHERPDGDALASICAFSLLLERLKKDHKLFCNDQVPALFNFIPNSNKIKNDKDLNWGEYDLTIVVDCGALSRTKLEKEIRDNRAKQFIIEFDHHPKVDDYADLEIRIPDISSTAEVIYRFFKENDLEFGKDIATCILTGILTDTINFLNTSTTAETIAISSEMLSEGALMPKINRYAWKNKNIHSMKVLGNILDNLKINPDHSIAFACLAYEEMEKFSETEETFDSVMNFLSNIDDVKAVMLLREERPGSIKGSIRTNNPKIDVSKIAKLLGGGGHAKASGFKIDGKIIKTEKTWEIK
ncbi:hypothetical protein GF382_00345 [Candidatus Falkowbacteria bacterium]|nr:hypothetical protein [Candidatus Falkowbacteria bacterium]